MKDLTYIKPLAEKKAQRSTAAKRMAQARRELPERAAAHDLAVALDCCMTVMEMDKSDNTVAFQMGRAALEKAGRKYRPATNWSLGTV